MIEIESKKIGAELTSLKFNGKEKLHNGEEYWNRHSPILFPIVGRLKDDKTIISNKEYQMKQHGFARDMEFKEIRKNKDEHKYVLKSSDETKKYYPYKFELYVTYKVDNIRNEVTVRYDVINKDEKQIIFGIGAHPAFVCNYSSGDYQIMFVKKEEDIEILELENGNIKNNSINSENKLVLDNLKKYGIIDLTEDLFENDAIILKNIKSNKCILRNINDNSINKEILEVDFTGFPYLGIWSKKGAPFVCVEPWYNTADYIDSDGIFKNKKDIIKLDLKEKFKCEYKIRIMEV